MKNLLIAIFALTITACSKKGGDPAPTPSSPVVYLGASGQPVAVLDYGITLTTAPPTATSGQRRSLNFRAAIPNERSITVRMSYRGTGIPGVGPVALDEVIVYTYPPTGASTAYTVPNRAGATLTIVSSSPRVATSTYVGPLVSGGPSVKLVFEKVAF